MSESSSSPMDYAEHEKTYKNFIRLLKWTGVASAIVLLLMAFFLL